MNLLDDLEEFLARFVAFPSDHALVAAVLWIVHSHAIKAFESTPRLALLSPEPGSGKTRALELFELLTPAPMHVLSASPAAIFRSIDADPTPTLLFDEVDAIFGRNGKSEDNEDLRGLLNAGHRAGATIPRCVGPTHNVAQFPVYAAVALAGLGDLPDTLMTRSVVIRMRRRRPTEVVEPFRYRIHSPAGHELRDRIAEWTADRYSKLRDARPEMPPGIEDRPADVWEPLLAVADVAGVADARWSERARAACQALAGQAVSREASLGIRLLTDLRTVFVNTDKMATTTILERLHELEESPWADLRGRPLDARGLAYRLSQYEVGSRNVRLDDGRIVKGYTADDLFDAWARYVPHPPQSATSATAATPQDPTLDLVADGPPRSATSSPAATDLVPPDQACSGRSGRSASQMDPEPNWVADEHRESLDDLVRGGGH